MKLFAVALLALVLAAPAFSATTRGETLRATVCTQQTLWTKPIPRRSDITQLAPFVNGHELSTVGVGQSKRGEYESVEGSGYGVIVRISTVYISARSQRLKVRVASVRDDCPRFRLLVRWH